MNQKEANRIEAFRQLKTEIRNSQRHLIVGIDVAKDKHHAFFGTAYGKTIQRRLVFANTRQGFENLLVVAETHLKSNGLDIPVFALEPTGNYHKPLGELLIRRGFHVVLTSGVAVSRNRELLDGRWDKNDAKDAANVADLVSQGKFLFYDFPRKDVREIQDLTSLKIKLKKLEHGWKVRIRNHLAAVYFPELDKHCAANSVLSMTIVRQMLDPREIAGMDFDDFCLKATDRDRGLKQQQRLEAIHKAAQSSVGCDFTEAAAFEARMMVDNLRSIRENIKRTDAMILKFVTV